MTDDGPTQAVDRAFDQGMGLGIVTVVAGVVIALWQLYNYARSGLWASVSLADLLGWMGSQWARWPTDWLGLHHVLAVTPASVGIGSLGLISAWSWYHLRRAMLHGKRDNAAS